MVSGDTQEVLDVWSRVTRRSLSRGQRSAFVAHPAVPDLARALRRIGATELEEAALELKSEHAFSLHLWAWVARRRMRRASAAIRRRRGRSDLAEALE